MRVLVGLLSAAGIVTGAATLAQAHGGGHPTPWPTASTTTYSYTPVTYFPTYFPSVPGGPSAPTTPVSPGASGGGTGAAGPTGGGPAPTGPSSPNGPSATPPTGPTGPAAPPPGPAAPPPAPMPPNGPAAPAPGPVGGPAGPAAPAPPAAPGGAPPIPPAGVPANGAAPAGPVQGPAGGFNRPTAPNSPAPPGNQRPMGRPARPTQTSPASAETDRSRQWENWWHRNQWRFLEARGGAQRTGRGDTTDDSAQLLRAFLTQLALKDEHREPRAAAVIALGKLGALDSREPLERLLQHDRDPMVREAAALSLGMMRSQASAGLLHRVAADRTHTTGLRVYAISGIGLLRDPSGVAPLLQRLAARDEREVHVAAATALGVIGDPGALDGLLTLARAGSHGPLTRTAAVTALAKCGAGSPRHAECLEAVTQLLLTCRHDDVRRAAALGLPRFADVRAFAPLHRVIRADHDFVTSGFAMLGLAELAAALGDTGDHRAARESLQRQLDTGRTQAKGYAAIGLGLLGRADPGCAPLLLTRLHRQSSSSAAAAVAIGLGLCAGAEASAPLAQLARDGSVDHLRGYACVSLGMVGARVTDPNIGAFLTAVVTDVNIPEVRAAAALGLSKMGGSGKAIDALRTIIRSRNQYLKLSAILTLGYFRDESTIADFVELYAGETQALARALAVVALGHVGETQQPPVLRLISGDFNYLAAHERLPAMETILRLF